MGGFGSGRRGGGRCTDDMRPLDVRKINRGGLLPRVTPKSMPSDLIRGCEAVFG